MTIDITVKSALIGQLKQILSAYDSKFKGATVQDLEQDRLFDDFLSQPSHPPVFAFLQAAGADSSKKKLGISDKLSADSELESVLYLSRSPKEVGDGAAVNLSKLAQFGVINNNTHTSTSTATFNSFLRVMDKFYSPAMINSRHKLPEEVEGELHTNMYRFMASCTDNIGRVTHGPTTLYIPTQDLGDSISSRSIHRLELLLSYWTRQIKSAVSSQANNIRKEVGSGDNGLLLAEVSFWRGRSDDLNGLEAQIDGIEVKNVLRILQQEKSPSCDEFLKLTLSIQSGAMEAERNLKALEAIVDTCNQLNSSDFSTIQTLLPKLLVKLRLVTHTAKYYQSEERLCYLYRLLGMDLIARCRSMISLERIQAGHSSDSVEMLTSVIACCNFWKGIFSKYQAHLKTSVPLWNITETAFASIFAPVDAFVQRCNDLKDVILYQTQFIRVFNCEKLPIVSFGNTSGPKIEAALEHIDLECSEAFEKLFSDPSAVLDVSNANWHSIYGVFKMCVKELESKFIHTVNLAFEEAKSLDQIIYVFVSFSEQSLLPSFEPVLAKKSAEIGKMLLDSLFDIKFTYEKYRLTPDILRAHPDFSGAAYWASTLQNKANYVQRQHQSVQDLLQDETNAQLIEAFDSLKAALDSFQTTMMKEWSAEIPERLLPTLNRPLLIQEPNHLIRANFPLFTSRTINEGELWSKQKAEVPLAVQEILSHKKDLLGLHRNVLTITREYNALYRRVPKECLDLFQDHIWALDSKLTLGLRNLTWSVKGKFDSFFRQFKKAANEFSSVLDQFFVFTEQILCSLLAMAGASLCKLETKKVYRLSEFADLQANHRSQISSNLRAHHEEIKRCLDEIQKLFPETDGNMSWDAFVRRIDSFVEKALQHAVKKSLHDLSKAVNGEGKNPAKSKEKSEIVPLFTIDVTLENQKIEFNPPMSHLQAAVEKVADDLISIVIDIPSLEKKGDPLANREKYTHQEEVVKIFAAVQSGVERTVARCQEYVHTWDSYREIWEINKDAFIRRYAKLKPPTSTFDADIGRYHEVANNAQKEETFTNVDFIRLDASSLKLSIVSHCTQWQEKLSTLLSSNAANDLKALYGIIGDRLKRLSVEPSDLEKLADLATDISKQKEGLSDIQARFSPIQENYLVLEKYEVSPKDEDQALLDGLDEHFESYLSSISDAEKRLNEAKTVLRNQLLGSLEKFANAASTFKDEILDYNLFFKFSNEFPTVQNGLQKFEGRCKKMIAEEKDLRKGMVLFRIDQAPSRDMEQSVRTIEVLKSLWTVIEQWYGVWMHWSTKQLADLEPFQIAEDFSGGYAKKLAKFSKDAKGWDCYEHVLTTTQSVIQIAPIVEQLKNPSLKQRHWAEISTLLGKNCNPFDHEFTLERMIQYGLSDFHDQIKTISESTSSI